MPARYKESHQKGIGLELKDIILGAQDGLVNVLGVVLAVAAATSSTKIIIIAGMAATFAESISMAAVAYTSTKALRDYYLSEMEKEKHEMKAIPKQETKEIRDIYRKKGFSGKLLEQIVKKIVSNKKLWLQTMMKEELGLDDSMSQKPINSAAVVGFSALIGSLFPIIPFFLFDVQTSIILSLVFSVFALFGIGSLKAKLTSGNWLRNGLEISVIGIVAALVGYFIGNVLGVALV